MSGAVLNESIHFHNRELYVDSVRVRDVAQQVGTPVYIYSLRRALYNLERIRRTFAALHAHIHYSIKANGNLAVLRALAGAGAGMDAVSGGEIYRARAAGVRAEDIVFAGVGKTVQELEYALAEGVGWFNVENERECELLNAIAGRQARHARVALRLNPDVVAHTHRHIATGHGGAKFGLSAPVASAILAAQDKFPNLRFEGIHVHIGSQLHDTDATAQAVRSALALIAPYPAVRTVNIGGGLPVPYRFGEALPSLDAFAAALAPLLAGYNVILEPGRSIIADAGILVTEVLYVKEHGADRFAIVDAGMTELIRPALYEAHHEIISIDEPEGTRVPHHVAGPVCETTDVLAKSVALPQAMPGDLLAILTAGAYGMVMASNYNARPRPPEVVVDEDGRGLRIARRRETWHDLIALETPES